MQPVCSSKSAPARPLTCQARVTTARSLGAGAPGRRVAVTPTTPRARALASRARAGGSGEAVEPVPVARTEEAVAEELESLEEEAIAGEEVEGRRPTDYDRRAHIFEESSRVFRELKQRRDGDGDGDARGGGVHGGCDGTAAGTPTHQPQQLA